MKVLSQNICALWNIYKKIIIKNLVIPVQEHTFEILILRIRVSHRMQFWHSEIFSEMFLLMLSWSLFVQKYNICWALIIKFCNSKSANYFNFDKHPIWIWFIDKLKKATVTMSNPMHKMHLNNIYNQLANLCQIVALLSAGSGIKICKSFADADRVLFTVQGSTDMHGVNSFVQTKTNVAVSKITSFHSTHANLMSLLWYKNAICVDILNKSCKSFFLNASFPWTALKFQSHRLHRFREAGWQVTVSL